MKQRHGLTLHVRAHERAVRVVVLEERDECSGDGHELLGRNVDELHLIRCRHHEVSALAAGDQFVGDAVLGVELRVGLGDGVFRLFHRRQVNHFIGDVLVGHAAIRAFDEAVLIHAREGRERVDQTDVRAFRRFDRADTAIMRRMHVAHFETCAFARQAAGPERGHAALVGDFRERVGLVHELRELRRAEELAHGGGHGLCVDQVVRHDRVDIDRAHAFLDRAFHAQQADAELVFHQLAHRTHAAIAEIVDVVDFAAAVPQVGQRLHDGDDVFLAQDAHGVFRIEVHAHVHLHATDGRKVVAFAIEEQLAEQRFRRVERRRFAGAHHAVDVDQGGFAAVVLVHRHGVADVGTDGDAIDVDDVDLVETVFHQHRQIVGRQLVTGFDIDLARFGIDHIERRVTAEQFFIRHLDLLDAIFLPLAQAAHRNLLARFDQHFAGLRVDPGAHGFGGAHPVRFERGRPAAALGVLEGDLLVECTQDIFLREAERIEQRRRRQFAAAVDADMHDVLRIEFEIEPRTAIGDDASREQQLAG